MPKGRDLNPGVTKRSVLIGLILIPPNIFFLVNNHVTLSGLPTTLSLFYNVIIVLLLMVAFNSVLRFFLPSVALKEGELLTVYVMLSIASAMSGHDMMQTVVPALTHGFWYATPENDWKSLFWRYLPDWLVMSDERELKIYYFGGVSLYSMARIEHWIRPVLMWTSFFTVLATGMVCINSILRRRWIEQERLSYPIVQLPLMMSRRNGMLFRSKLMWMGFALAGGIDLLNGLHIIFPVLPEIPVRRYEIGRYFTSKPWNAIGWTPTYAFPFAIGLSFFMPLDMSFSFWFFYLIWKMEKVLGSALGLSSLPGFPYSGQQAIGAYLMLAIIALLSSRRYLSGVVRAALRGVKAPDEAMSYRSMLIILLLAFGYLLGFTFKAGMALWVGTIYFLLYYLIGISITRMRAELGPPTHEMFPVTPHNIMVLTIGSRRLGAQNLTVFGLLWGFNRGYRAHPMPHTLEGFKLAEQAGINLRRLFPVMILAAALGTFCAFWAFIDMCYREGGVIYPPWGGVFVNRKGAHLTIEKRPTSGTLSEL
ncbi:hypothetical protein J7M22_05800 [Candidatus Poribacteria bacterium]|nr:hypothetical protein [Candidatus Poribacteria bacterium]